MKTLPDNPNLDHLRRQAKDLLAGLRDSRPEASLADAQASLAERYGFRAWTDLKAEVERRCGPADVAGPELARAVAACFDLGSVTGPMRSLARPDDLGRRWSLETDRGRWAVRTVDGWVPIVSAEMDVALQEAAATAGVLLPPPVRSRSGSVVEEAGGYRWRAYGWVRCGPSLVAPVSVATAHAVGGILATIHGLRLPVDRVSPYHSLRLVETVRAVPEHQWAGLAATAAARHAVWASDLAEAIARLAALEEIGEEIGEGAPPAPPPVLTHNNLVPGSVRQGPEGRPVVMGWEHAGGQPPSWELGSALLHWTVAPGGGVHAPAARALLDGYRARAGGLPPLDLTMFRGAVTGVGNYVWAQVEEALGAVDPEELRHTTRNVRHLLSHLPSRADLEELLEVAGSGAR